MLPPTLKARAARIRSGEQSAVEAVLAALALLDDFGVLEPTAWRDDAAVLARAEAADEAMIAGHSVGPLHGVPITVKDWIDVEGFPCAGGDGAHRERRPLQDATVVARLRSAGAIVVAKSSAGEGSDVYGTPRNPWDSERTPGHSSSGDAIAVSIGAVPLGLGSDSGGSLRFPAHCSGVAAIRPTYGLVPGTGHFPPIDRMSDGRTVIGPICGTSADLGTVLELIAGADRIDPDCPPLGFSTGSSTEGLRVLVHRDESVAPDSDVIAVLERSAGALSDAGHEVSEADALEPSRALEITQRYWNRPLPTGEATEAFLADWQSFRRRGMELMRSTDVIISPGAPYPAPAIGKSTDLDWSYTLAASLWGFPALVVPAGASGAGLPIGVQVVGAPWMDALVIAVGEYLEIPPGQSPTP